MLRMKDIFRITQNGMPHKVALMATLCYTSVLAQNVDYGPLHRLTQQFYGYQRAGEKDRDNKNPFYKTSPYPHSRDAAQGSDLSGGWYDAGDFVKFGLPFGFSIYALLKGYDAFPQGYDDVDSWDYSGKSDGIPDILGEAKIATDYLLKAVVSQSLIITDIGNAVVDHGHMGEDGYANSNRTSPRQIYSNTGADIAGLYSASLALMAKLYQKHDPAYAARCLAKAEEAFKFGLLNTKLSAQQNNGEFYSTKKWEDKMACAAVELYRVTQKADYLTHAKNFQGKVGSHYFVLGYANVGDISAFELKRLGENVEGPWLADVKLTMSRVVKSPSASPLIKGAFINSDWGNAGHAGCAAFSAALAYLITGEDIYRDFIRSQVHWVAGLAPFTQSYVVGFGNGPTAPHHRNDNTIGKQGGPRLKGGVVSGPTPQGAFDPSKPESVNWSFNGADVNNYRNTEVALNYNAGIVGALAFLRDYDKPAPGTFRLSQALKVSPDNVNLNVAPAAITAQFETSQNWKVKLKGVVSGAEKVLSGTGVAVNLSWNGEADQGSFQTGEGVDVFLDMPGVATYHAMRAKTRFFLTATKKEGFKASDQIIDDFEDGDVLNALKAPWAVFNDAIVGGKSFTNPPTATGLVVAKEGDSLSKGLTLRVVVEPGALRPHAGVKTLFTPTGVPISLGKSSGLVFDIKGAQGATISVEVETADITDSAFYGRKISFGNDNWTRQRLSFASFAQPEWKSKAVPFNTGKAVSIRFVQYGVGSLRFNVDNLRLENGDIGGVSIRMPKRLKSVQTQLAPPVFRLAPTGNAHYELLGRRQLILSK